MPTISPDKNAEIPNTAVYDYGYAGENLSINNSTNGLGNALT